MTGEQLLKVMDELDFQGNRRLNYSEFLAATINVHEFLTEERLEAVFKKFDVDEQGHITKENFK
jgi:Ca2+-binding EF-hand superfamily protein